MPFWSYSLLHLNPTSNLPLTFLVNQKSTALSTITKMKVNIFEMNAPMSKYLDRRATTLLGRPVWRRRLGCRRLDVRLFLGRRRCSPIMGFLLLVVLDWSRFRRIVLCFGSSLTIIMDCRPAFSIFVDLNQAQFKNLDHRACWSSIRMNIQKPPYYNIIGI